MRKVLLLALITGCGIEETQITIPPSADLATNFDAASEDLAWTDLAGGVDIAQPPVEDLAASVSDMATQPPDLAPPPPDMVQCFSNERIGMACQFNYQCCNLCGYSALYPSGQACCYAPGTNCAQDSDCCGGSLHTSGTCNNKVCL